MDKATKAGLGGVARKGATHVRRDGGGGQKPPPRSGPERWEPERWVDEGPIRSAAEGAAKRGANRPVANPGGQSGRPSGPGRSRLPAEVRAELAVVAGGSTRAKPLEAQMAAARRAFERERYPEAKRVLAQVVERAPTAVSARELFGMTLYRLGKWREAAVQLEAFRELTGSADQNPMLADCYRAMRRYTEADELWDELKAASPSAEVMAEGRIVKAGTLADRGQLREAISLIEKALRPTKVVHDYHVRQWYALGDLYDRAGDAPRARALFERVRGTAGADFGDVGARLRALG